MPALALLQLFAPILGSMIPQIMSLLKPGSEVAQRNQGIAQVVLDTITKTAAAPNLQGAIEAMQSDPAVKSAVQQAIVTDPQIMQILEIGGGPAAARTADLEQQQTSQPFYKTSAVFWISMLMWPAVLWYVGSSIVGGIDVPLDWPWYAQLVLRLFGVAWDPGARVGLANLVVGLILGGICGVYYGVSVTQAKQQAQASADK